MFYSRTIVLSLALAASHFLPSSLHAKSEDIVLSDFEGENYGEWVVEGKAFAHGPQSVEATYLNRNGERLAISRPEFGGDAATGTLTSPPFVIERKYLSFLLGGGNHPEETCVELLIGDKVVASQPGFSRSDKMLAPVFWDLSKYQGQTARIRLADRVEGRVKGSWGHIAADDFILTDELPSGEALTTESDLPSAQGPVADGVLADFDGQGFASWKVEGLAFGNTPRSAQEISGADGGGFASSLTKKKGARDTQGALVSPAFVIDRDYLNFKIGGGDHAFRAAMSLWVDGRVVRTSTGQGRDSLAWESWDLRDLKGKNATVGIYDMCVEDEPGYVMVDSIQLADTARGPIGGDVDIALRKVRQEALAAIRKNAPVAAQDPQRPIYHYTPPAQNMNDPNGPAWHDGWHHLFYQYAVFSPKRVADMHWGHARSRDLVNWETLPLAFAPSYELGEQSVYSGNMGRDKNGEPVQFTTMVPYKSDAWRRVWTARPADPDWIVWKKSPVNPPDGLVPAGNPNRHFKDPFPFSCADRCFVVLTDQTAKTVVLYEATDDKSEKWTLRGDIVPKGPIEDECPNFFEVDGHWLLLSSPHDQPRYQVGTFDPVTGKFSVQREGRLNHAADYFAPGAPADAKPNSSTGFYATTAYRDDKGRTILHGISKRLGGKGWTGALAMPRVLSIGPDVQPRMHPLPELQSLRGAPLPIAGLPWKLDDASRVVEGVSGDAIEIIARFRVDDAKAFGLRVRRGSDGREFLPIEWRDGRITVIAENPKYPIKYEIDPQTREIVLHAFLDKVMLDVVTGDGKVFESRIHDSPLENLGVEVFAEGGSATLLSLDAWEMKPAKFDHKRLFDDK